jgi:hypothetical protein
MINGKIVRDLEEKRSDVLDWFGIGQSREAQIGFLHEIRGGFFALDSFGDEPSQIQRTGFEGLQQILGSWKRLSPLR